MVALRRLAVHSRLAVRAQRRALATAKPPASLFSPLDTFPDRHIGPDNGELAHMLSQLGYDSMDTFIRETVPQQFKVAAEDISDEVITPLSELELNRRAKELATSNKPFKSYIGMGYHNAVVPPVILRNVIKFRSRAEPFLLING
jgi:glycine dehydrogenase